MVGLQEKNLKIMWKVGRWKKLNYAKGGGLAVAKTIAPATYEKVEKALSETIKENPTSFHAVANAMKEGKKMRQRGVVQYKTPLGSLDLYDKNKKEWLIGKSKWKPKEYAKGGKITVEIKNPSQYDFNRKMHDAHSYGEQPKFKIIGHKNNVMTVYGEEKEIEKLKEILADEHYAKGGALEKEFKFDKNFVIYVPSTSNVGQKISKKELETRVDEVEKYVANEFGGYTETDTDGGYKSTTGEIIEEDIIKVSVFANNKDWKDNEKKVVSKVKEWAKRWGQEAIGFEYEGDLYYIDDEGKFSKGGLTQGKARKHRNIKGKLRTKLEIAKLAVDRWGGDNYQEIYDTVEKHYKNGTLPDYKDFHTMLVQGDKPKEYYSIFQWNNAEDLAYEIRKVIEKYKKYEVEKSSVGAMAGWSGTMRSTISGYIKGEVNFSPNGRNSYLIGVKCGGGVKSEIRDKLFNELYPLFFQFDEYNGTDGGVSVNLSTGTNYDTFGLECNQYQFSNETAQRVKNILTKGKAYAKGGETEDKRREIIDRHHYAKSIGDEKAADEAIEEYRTYCMVKGFDKGGEIDYSGYQVYSNGKVSINVYERGNESYYVDVDNRYSLNFNNKLELDNYLKSEGFQYQGYEISDYAKGGDIVTPDGHKNLKSISDIKNVVGEKVWSRFTNNNDDEQTERWNKFFKDHNGTVVIQIYDDEVEISANSNQDYSDDISFLETYLKEDFESEHFAEGGLTPQKAKKILKDGSVHGRPLTDKQKRYFGALSASNEKEVRERARRSKMDKGGKIDVDNFIPSDMKKKKKRTKTPDERELFDRKLNLRFDIRSLEGELNDIEQTTKENLMEMEQTAEAEGGPIADRLGAELEDLTRRKLAIEKLISQKQQKLDDLEMN